MTEPIRLSKRVADLAGCSRRDAELYIEGGWVQVNGLVVEEPQQQLVYDEHGRCYELVAPAGEESPVVLLLKTRCNVINYMACRVVCKQEIAPRLRELRHLPLDPASRAVPISNFT